MRIQTPQIKIICQVYFLWKIYQTFKVTQPIITSIQPFDSVGEQFDLIIELKKQASSFQILGNSYQPDQQNSKRQTIFSNQFGHRLKSDNHAQNEQKLEDDLMKNLPFDNIYIQRGRQVKDRNYFEQLEGAQILSELLRLRQNYAFTDHQDYCKVDDFVQYDEETQEPLIMWNKVVETLPILKEADILNEDGVYYTTIKNESIVAIPRISQFIKDLITLMDAVNNNSVAGFCYNRLKYLEQKYKMHQIFNLQYEQSDQKQIKSKDFYNILKVDNHIHHSAAMSAKHLLKFIKHKLEQEHDTHVYMMPDRKKLTLNQIFQSVGLKHNELSLNSLDVQADKGTYKRFDRFNNKYNPLGQPKLREIFLKSDNFIKGRYLAELTKELIVFLEDQKYVGTEWRLSIYGKSMEEWHKLGKWIIRNKLYSTRVRWMIQIPRLYQVYRKSGLVKNFQQMLDNIFRPLFDITINPTMDQFLYQALFQIVGFDTVDDESIYENFSISDLKTIPQEWVKDKNPPYTYWIYYIYANIYSLNALRKLRGLNTFQFRPHCGEAGDIDHLSPAYLVADSINHGLELVKSPVLTYLYYLMQIGLAMSPVSNNRLFCRYSNSPFRKLFELGMNVTLSTDDPLILHMTNEPLIEEYSIASQVFDLSNLDLAEIARNSIRQSGFENKIKEFWLGPNYRNRLQKKSIYLQQLRIQLDNEEVNNLPNSRFEYRKTTLNDEWKYIQSLLDKSLV